MDRLKILITGGNGYIAKSIYSYLYSKYDITLLSRADLDFTDRERVKYYSFLTFFINFFLVKTRKMINLIAVNSVVNL